MFAVLGGACVGIGTVFMGQGETLLGVAMSFPIIVGLVNGVGMVFTYIVAPVSQSLA